MFWINTVESEMFWISNLTRFVLRLRVALSDLCCMCTGRRVLCVACSEYFLNKMRKYIQNSMFDTKKVSEPGSEFFLWEKRKMSIQSIHALVNPMSIHSGAHSCDPKSIQCQSIGLATGILGSSTKAGKYVFFQCLSPACQRRQNDSLWSLVHASVQL